MRRERRRRNGGICIAAESCLLYTSDVYKSQLVFCADVREQLFWLRRFFSAYTEHGSVGFAFEVAIGKAAAGKGCLQVPALRGCGTAVFAQQRGIDGRDHGHIFRPFHAPFQLQAGDAHSGQLRNMIGQAHVLQAQGITVILSFQRVGQAAGLGAGAPVAAAPADHGAHGALAGVAHAQGPMAEHLHLRPAATADGLHIPVRQLPGQQIFKLLNNLNSIIYVVK